MFIVPLRRRATSRRSRELAARLSAVIADYRRQEPSVSPEEIGSALSELEGDDAIERNHRRRSIVGSTVGLMAALSIGMAVSAKQHADANQLWPLALVGIGLIAVVVALLVRWRDR